MHWTHSECIPSKVDKQVMQPTCTNIYTHIYIYIHGTPKKLRTKRQPKIDTTYCKYQQKSEVNIVFFWGGGTIYTHIYIYICARLHDVA